MTTETLNQTKLTVPVGLAKWTVFRARIAGVTPLLMHNPAQMRRGEDMGRTAPASFAGVGRRASAPLAVCDVACEHDKRQREKRRDRRKDHVRDRKKGHRHEKRHPPRLTQENSKECFLGHW